MKLPTYQFVAQMGAAFAVVVSLGFVAYELKQARDIALAEIYQQKSALIVDLNMSAAEYPELLEANLKLETSPDSLELSDFYLLRGEFAAFLSYYENNHFLYQYGMITQEQWNTIRVEISLWLNANEFYRAYWMRSSKRGSWRASFAKEVDDILADLGPVRISDGSYPAKDLEKRRCLASGKCQAENSPL